MDKQRFIVIGFPRSGTLSLQKYFNGNHVNALHYIKGSWERDYKPIGKIIMDNKDKGIPLLAGLEETTALTQIDWVGFGRPGEEAIFPQLTEVPLLKAQYPEAKFILNIRPFENWINSINNFVNLRGILINSDIPYLPKGKGIKDSDLIMWYKTHIKRMKKLFEKAPKTLLVVNIEKVNINELNNFCELYRVTSFPHVGYVGRGAKVIFMGSYE